MRQAPPTLTPEFDSDDFQRDLYRHYRTFHQEIPVFRSDEGVVYVTRHSHCVDMMSHSAFRRQPPGGGSGPFSNVQREPSPLEYMISHWLVYMDPPRHDEVRKVFGHAFNVRAVDQLEPGVWAISEELADSLSCDDSIEFIKAFACPFPLMVIAGILGVPREDWPLFSNWALQLSQSLNAGRDSDMLAGASASLAMLDYFTGMVRARHQTPGDDLLSELIVANKGGQLSENELVFGCAFLLWAGHETSKNMISSALLLLGKYPDDRESLRRVPALIDGAVEETLRFESPVQKISRWTHTDFLFDDYRIPAGTLVTALIGAANRDPAVFEAPDEFNIRRLRNRHIAFGKGIHHCLGATLTRLEGRVALQTLLKRFGRVEIEDYRWRPLSAFRSLGQLQLCLHASC